MLPLMHNAGYGSSPSPSASGGLKKGAHTIDPALSSSLSSSSLITGAPLLPTMQINGPRSMHSRSAYLIDRIAFWRKHRATASEVQSTLNSLSKSHEKYCEDLHAAYEAITEWARYISPPSQINEDLLQHTFDDNVGEQITYLLDMMRPVIRTEKEAREAHVGFAHSFQAIKQQEENLRTALRRQESAERRYFKAMVSERHSERHRAETFRLNEERERLASNVEDAALHLRNSIRRELPMRFNQYSTYYSALAYASGRAGENISNALNDPDFPLGEILSYRNMVESPANESRSSFYSPQLPYGLHSEIAPLNMSRYTKLSSALNSDLDGGLDSALHIAANKAPSQPGDNATTPDAIERKKESEVKPKSNIAVNDIEIADFSNDNFVWT